jgi:hypothetical protein
MKKYRAVAQELKTIERSAWVNPRVEKMLKAAPMILLFLLLNARSGHATCSFNPSPDPTVDGSPDSLRAAIQAVNASSADCTIMLSAGTYTLTIKNTHGHEDFANKGDLNIRGNGHTTTIVGASPATTIVNANGIDRAFQVMGRANAVFENLTIENGLAQDDGTPGTKPGTTEAKGGGILVQGHSQVLLNNVIVRKNQAVGANGENGAGGIGVGTAAAKGTPGQAAAGGGIFLFNGTLNLTNSTLSGNTVTAGFGGNGGLNCFRTTFGSVLCAPGPGGAGGTGGGGGLYVFSATAELSLSTISGNAVQGGYGGAGGGSCTGPNGPCVHGAGGIGGAAQGAGIYILTGALDLAQDTISSNTASGGKDPACTVSNGCQASLGSTQGGGIFVSNGDITLSNSTLFANAADPFFGLAPYFGSFPPYAFIGASSGGGIYLAGGTISLTGVTIASNQAGGTQTGANGTVSSGSGGGIANAGATGLTINSTLIADNTQDSGNAENGNDDSGPITASFSLIGQSEGATVTNNGGSLIDVDPMLSTTGLTHNGGPTQTIALQEGSPAIDAIPLENCSDQASPPNPLITDQRGFPRPDAGEADCDIGAYEVQDTASTPFRWFSGLLTITSDAGGFELASRFKLGGGGSTDPTTQTVTFGVGPVTFGVGSYAIRLPPGSFVSDGSGYLYHGIINGGFLRMFLEPTDMPGIYALIVGKAIAGGPPTGPLNPVPVTLTIGDNFGTAQINATSE